MVCLTQYTSYMVSVKGSTTARVIVNGLDTPHSFIVVDNLSASVILGCDFLFNHGITLDFGNGTFQCNHHGARPEEFESQKKWLNMLVLDEITQAVPCSVKDTPQVKSDMPQKYYKALKTVLNYHTALFRCQLDRTNVTQHVIDTSDGTPVKLPPRPIPFHYSERVQSQLKDTAEEGIIEPSNSSWCAPAVCVPKSNGEIIICMDFVQLNKTTKRIPILYHGQKDLSKS